MKKNPVGTIIVLIAAVIAVLGLALPFYKVDAFGLNMTVSLLYADGVAIAGVLWAIFVALTLIFALIGKKVPVLIFGILASLGLFLSYALNNSTLSEYESLGAYIEKGIGNTLCLVGAIAILVASIIYMITTKSNKAEQ